MYTVCKEIVFKLFIHKSNTYFAYQQINTVEIVIICIIKVIFNIFYVKHGIFQPMYTK